MTNKLRIYQEHFERQYIDSTREFYTVHGRACLSENGVQNYMTYVSFLCSPPLLPPSPSAGKMITLVSLRLMAFKFSDFQKRKFSYNLIWRFSFSYYNNLRSNYHRIHCTDKAYAIDREIFILNAQAMKK